MTASLETAKASGDQGMALSYAKAQGVDPDFHAKAERAILSHLKAKGECSGEELTDIAKLHGAIPHDDRAFGTVYRNLSQRGLIRTVRLAMRVKGHGTPGARIWGLAQSA